VKTFLNWTMPELANSNVGSLRGTSGLDGTISCPLRAKYSRSGAGVVGGLHGLILALDGRHTRGSEVLSQAADDCVHKQKVTSDHYSVHTGEGRCPGRHWVPASPEDENRKAR